MARAKPGETNDQLNARGLKYRMHFVAETLPDEAISRLADGRIPGSSRQSSATANRPWLRCTLLSARPVRDGRWVYASRHSHHEIW